MSLKLEMAADLAGILSEVGEQVTWSGQPFQALVSAPAIGEDLEIGGFASTGEFSIKIMREAFSGSLPEIGQLIELGGKSYRINQITDHQRNPMVVFSVSPE